MGGSIDLLFQFRNKKVKVDGQERFLFLQRIVGEGMREKLPDAGMIVLVCDY